MAETVSPKRQRESIVGPESGPEPPFPLRMKGEVVSGFGRGSKELGIPTANIPVDAAPWIAGVDSGVYFGWAGIKFPSSHPSHPSYVSPSSTPNPLTATALSNATSEDAWQTYPMVMSIGYNPFYANKTRSAEVHILQKFDKDFYGSEMALTILGFIRPEYDYVSKESLIQDIMEDCRVTERSLDRPKWAEFRQDGYLKGEERIA